MRTWKWTERLGCTEFKFVLADEMAEGGYDVREYHGCEVYHRHYAASVGFVPGRNACGRVRESRQLDTGPVVAGLGAPDPDSVETAPI